MPSQYFNRAYLLLYKDYPRFLVFPLSLTSSSTTLDLCRLRLFSPLPVPGAASLSDAGGTPGRPRRDRKIPAKLLDQPPPPPPPPAPGKRRGGVKVLVKVGPAAPRLTVRLYGQI